MDERYARTILALLLYGAAVLPAFLAVLTGVAARRRIAAAHGALMGADLATVGILLGLLNFLCTSALLALATSARPPRYNLGQHLRPRPQQISPERRAAEQASPFKRYRVPLEQAGTQEEAQLYQSAIRQRPTEPERALEILCEVLDRNPRHEPALLERGFLHLERADPESACRDFATLVSLRPDNPEAYALRARSLDALGEKERALADWERCLALDNGGQYYGEAQLAAAALRQELAR
ncbi:MAG: hypothetical protein HZA54_07590 [Planctomycetes bacterium]|nr:hypothetical protein [Planctomycetota bacterium]